jgi:iron complex transport system substrate-binding protein
MNGSRNLRPILLAAMSLLLAISGGRGDEGEAGKPPAAEPRFERIIATAPSNTEVLCALGLTDKIVGVSSYVAYPPEVQALPRIGGIDDPDLEKILALRPDLIVLRGGNPNVERLCRKTRITLYHDRTDSLPSIFTTVRELGSLTGREAQAERIATDLRQQLDRVRAESAGRSRPRVLLTVRSPDKLTPLTTVGRPSFLHDVIEIAGGENVFGDTDLAYPQASLEEVLARRPGVIIEAMPGIELDDARRAEIVGQWKELAGVPAVASGQVHVLTEDYVLIPSLRVGVLAERLAAIFKAAAEEPAGSK